MSVDNPVEGHAEYYWPQPGRVFAAARSHTFKSLADAIDDAFARWDRSHLQEFTLADETRPCHPDYDWEIDGEVIEDYRRARVSRLRPRKQFVYAFDIGAAGPTCARSASRRSTQATPWASSRIGRCPTGGGAMSRISTGAGGTVMMASRHSHQIPGSPIFLPYSPLGHRQPTGEGRPLDTEPALTLLRGVGTDEGSPPVAGDDQATIAEHLHRRADAPV